VIYAQGRSAHEGGASGPARRLCGATGLIDGTVAVQIVLARVVKTFGEETGLREDIAQWA
jgi:hypothetical protein